ncbi:hypothetical protein BCR34DRAFT_584577 [Clohesyomyces aquaticus]|uniref:Uncharacterized protein n=1 Tax=Clohesyomyces aquaticus TaxID=1231657 RepID=A0A1Y2A0T7_9PLEO|nr:hypothetical protein BCR34DRAFT_584577 [Clohesyomyces aquaticus]
MSPLPVVICGKNPAIAAIVKDTLQPAYEAIHIITSVEQGTTDIPLLLTGKTPPNHAGNGGTKKYASVPVAIITGGGYDDEAFDTLKAACKDVKEVPWFRPDMSRMSEMPSTVEDYARAVSERCKIALKALLEGGKGKHEGREGVYYY